MSKIHVDVVVPPNVDPTWSTSAYTLTGKSWSGACQLQREGSRLGVASARRAAAPAVLWVQQQAILHSKFCSSDSGQSRRAAAWVHRAASTRASGVHLT